MARKGKMIEKIIDSNYLQETMSIKIYKPEEFDSLFETNLCFMQDGNDYFQMGRVATVSDRLHEEESIANTVFIGIHYIDRADRLKKYHPDGAQYLAYQHFLIKEVLPLVDTLVPINPLGTIRTLIGDSLAGTFALVTAVQHPSLFHKVIMQSPLIDETVLSIIKDAEVRRLSIYHSIGLDEGKVLTSTNHEVDFVEPNKALANYLSKLYSDYEYVEIKKGNHTWKYWQEELPEILEKMLS